jgi:hypothetical protein
MPLRTVDDGAEDRLSDISGAAGCEAVLRVLANSEWILAVLIWLRLPRSTFQATYKQHQLPFRYRPDVSLFHKTLDMSSTLMHYYVSHHASGPFLGLGE